MLRFKSLTSRVLLLHIVAMAVVAIFLPLVLFGLLISEVNHLHREAMQDQAAVLGDKLALKSDGTMTLDLPESLKDLYSEAYGRYQYEILDGSDRVLFSSHKNGDPIALPAGSPPEALAGASVSKEIGGRTVRIQVAEDLAHRDVIIDDIITNFFRRVGWITIPILLILLGIDIVIFRRAIAPLVRASEEAKSIGPARTDVRLPTLQIPSEILPLVTAVNQALDRLEDGFRLQRQFTADAAHQLRTPLAILQARIDTLGGDARTLELQADIKSMGRIVSQLLAIAELDALALDPSETADLRAVCAEVVGSIAPYALAAHKDITLGGTNNPVWIRGNAEMLQRAIFNLAENAIKFTALDTAVDVDLRDDGSVRVRDHGPGISPDEHGLIFQRFWRGDRRRTDGAGLGLSIVHEVAQGHSATVAVENLAAGGTQFTLCFQLANDLPSDNIIAGDQTKLVLRTSH